MSSIDTETGAKSENDDALATRSSAIREKRSCNDRAEHRRNPRGYAGDAGRLGAKTIGRSPSRAHLGPHPSDAAASSPANLDDAATQNPFPSC